MLPDPQHSQLPIVMCPNVHVNMAIIQILYNKIQLGYYSVGITLAHVLKLSRMVPSSHTKIIS